MTLYKLQAPVITGDEKVFGIEHHTIQTAQLPISFDLRTAFPNCIQGILTQGDLGSCAANELSNALKFCIAKEKGILFQPSRLFLYYFGRLYEGSDVNQDTGMSISGACGSIVKYGACNENNWVYDITKFNVQPSRPAIISGHRHCYGYKFFQVPQDINHIKQALFSGFPILAGIQVYSSFETDQVARTGVVPIPNVGTEQKLGGHAIQIFSYSDILKTFTCSNSWGTFWGLPSSPGYFTIPYAYILDITLAGDLVQINYFK